MWSWTLSDATGTQCTANQRTTNEEIKNLAFELGYAAQIVWLSVTKLWFPFVFESAMIERHTILLIRLSSEPLPGHHVRIGKKRARNIMHAMYTAICKKRNTYSMHTYVSESDNVEQTSTMSNNKKKKQEKKKIDVDRRKRRWQQQQQHIHSDTHTRAHTRTHTHRETAVLHSVRLNRSTYWYVIWLLYWSDTDWMGKIHTRIGVHTRAHARTQTRTNSHGLTLAYHIDANIFRDPLLSNAIFRHKAIWRPQLQRIQCERIAPCARIRVALSHGKMYV